MVCVRKAKDEELATAVVRGRTPGSISLFSTPFFLRANKSTGYRLSVLTLSQSLAEALDELQLTTTRLTDRFAENNEHFHIVDLDLNPSGKAFAKIAFRTWLAKTDRWKQESKTVPKLKESLIAEYRKFEVARGAA
jgi:hypothetical protein